MEPCSPIIPPIWSIRRCEGVSLAATGVSMRRATLTFAALLSFSLSASAQNIFTYTGGDASPDWRKPANWNGFLFPLPGNQTVVRFSSNTNGGMPNQNFGNPFVLNQMEFASALPAIKIVGDPLDFVNGPAGPGSTPDLIVSNSNPVEIANLIRLSGNLQIDVQRSDGSLTLSGNFPSDTIEGLNKGGPGRLTMTGAGTLKFLRTDTLGSLSITGGTYWVQPTAGNDIRLRGATDISQAAILTTPLLEIGDTGSPVVTISGGSSITADLVQISRGSTAVSRVTVSGAGTSVTGGAIGVGGGATAGAGGTATLTIDSGASVEATSMLVHPQGKVSLNSGSTLKVGTLSFTGSSNLDWKGGALHLTGANSLNSTLRVIDVASGCALQVDGALKIENNNTLLFSGGTGVLQDVAVGPIGTSSPGYLTITSNSISMANLSIGAGYVSVGGSGALNVSSTITIESNGELSVTSGASPRLTANTVVLNGGIISGSSVLNLSSIGTLRGHGTVLTRVSGTGAIVAEGDLVIGSATSSTGYATAGTLTVSAEANVLLLDADSAGLGSTTTLGAGSSLVTLNGVTLPSTGTISASASASISGELTTSGNIAGPTTAGEWLTLEDPVSGRGNFSGNIRMTDDYSVGSTGTRSLVTFSGNVEFGSGELRLDLSGVNRGTSSGYDAINCSGTLTLSGTLNVSLAGGYAPAVGASFDLFNWGSFSGSFSGITLPALPGDLSWNTANLYTSGVITVVPEPSVAVSMLPVVALLASRRKRRR